MVRGCLAAALAIGLTACGGGVSQEAGFQEACFEGIKRRLKAPATFDVVKVTPDHTKVPLRTEEQIRESIQNAEDDSLEKMKFRLELADLQSGDFDYRSVSYRSFVQYDAQNAMGVPLRSMAECEYEARAGEEISAEDGTDIIVDGEKYWDWAMGQLE